MRKDQTIGKGALLNWINSTLGVNETRIENLGTGTVYCLLMNHYYKNAIAEPKIKMLPRNPMDHRHNLKLLQEALKFWKVATVTFDVFKVAEMGFQDNWQLATKLYKHCTTAMKEDTNKIPNWSHAQRYGLMGMSHGFTQNSTGGFGFSSGCRTPMKSGYMKSAEEPNKQNKNAGLVEEIKSIVKEEEKSDKLKVGMLKKLLGMLEDDTEDREDGKDLLSDCKKKQEVIQID